MASKLSYQRNDCCSDIGNNCQCAGVFIDDISQRLCHSCCQDYTSAKKQIPRFADLGSAENQSDCRIRYRALLEKK